jgi:pantetheine-phosphate adenylyltransferase
MLQQSTLRLPLVSSFSQIHLSSFALRRMSTQVPAKLRTAIYAGTFDPPTSGHLDIMTRAATICDKLYVGLAVNCKKR